MRLSQLLLFIFLFTVPLTAGQMKDYEALALKSRDYRVLYNLGVLYMQAGNANGKAELALREAALLKPLDKDITEARLKLWRDADLPDNLLLESPFEKALLLPFSWFGINVVFISGFILFILGSTLQTLYFSGLIKKNWPLLKIPYRVNYSIAFLITGFVLIAASFIRNQIIFNPALGVVLNSAALTETPEPQGMKTVDASEGMDCTILKESGYYYLLNLADGHEGWTIKTNAARLWEENK